jgi:hypothetical protein
LHLVAAATENRIAGTQVKIGIGGMAAPRAKATKDKMRNSPRFVLIAENLNATKANGNPKKSMPTSNAAE